jgi:hypothetical protein
MRQKRCYKKVSVAAPPYPERLVKNEFPKRGIRGRIRRWIEKALSLY